MIQGFEASHPTEPEDKRHLQWLPAINAGLIAGGVLLVVPQGNPWSALDFFAPVVMGRVLSGSLNVPLVACFVMHLGLAVLYSLVIARVVVGVTQLRAVITGGVVGLCLYLANFAIVSLWIPDLRGNEVSVAFTHIVFGLIAAGAYRGLLRRKLPAIAAAQKP